ncbi:2Fe-2S iron-sulfur cluster binding domain-containing protein [Arthrobacter yangruifuii]|uniref:2Fe-2S iron-sulfur cluster binding domain-containing protein n=1 Tax=Arthrobacter yangruifuii TaxID=2606616 RepID=A0A5N6MR48_9MICC|nr:2Fe-2S iron-sulfur cluster binding domain-containing protein [Arthrobacter yangruifuii]KAD3720577.1 2Fe-2S iron-sulfur cluster binding domain-containing protein [Arthrobacter yangruifuii]
MNDTVTHADAPFTVHLSLSEKTYEVPADKGILQVLEEAGEPVISSCREGTCGTCETPVLSGEVDHRDSVLSDEERQANETMMICVSRCRGPRLELDI